VASGASLTSPSGSSPSVAAGGSLGWAAQAEPSAQPDKLKDSANTSVLVSSARAGSVCGLG
jgi:hypothetical protein